jgi:hypothetical protein
MLAWKKDASVRPVFTFWQFLQELSMQAESDMPRLGAKATPWCAFTICCQVVLKKYLQD